VDIPSVRRWKNGFVQGARFTDPSVKVLVNFVGSFTDPAKTATVAVGQAEQKADLIFVASGANLEASRQGAAHGFRTISTNVDEYAQEMKRGDDIAFAAADRMDDLAYKAVLDLRSAKPAKGTRSFGLADSVFAITQLTSDKLPGTRPLPEPVLDAGRRAKEGLTSHQVTVRNPEA
jgi:basic membrane protein A